MSSSLEAALGYQFQDRALLEAALTHRSYASEDAAAVDYERLEFLGDAVLQLAVTDRIFAAYPEMPEGQMAKLRATVVSEEVLAAIAGRLDVGAGLRLGKGEELNGGRHKPSILSDAVESVLGALDVEAGYATAAEIALRHVGHEIDRQAHAPGDSDFKTRLQEVLAQGGRHPEYRISDEGPDHDKVFHAEVIVDDRLTGSGSGSSKKAAEQAAAEKALDEIG